jgi:hypothetical protein
VRDVEATWTAAEVSGDIAVLDRILADESTAICGSWM